MNNNTALGAKIEQAQLAEQKNSHSNFYKLQTQKIPELLFPIF